MISDKYIFVLLLFYKDKILMSQLVEPIIMVERVNKPTFLNAATNHLNNRF